jgi:hypothetical protein
MMSMSSSNIKSLNLEAVFSKIVSGVKSRVISAWEFLSGLPEDSQTWGLGTVCFFGVTALVGGVVFNSSLVAAVFCAGTWALLWEKPTWGSWVCKTGITADLILTLCASMLMAGTSVSVAFSAVFFGVYFTACRRVITPMIPGRVASWKDRQAAINAEESAKEEEESNVCTA